MVYLILLLFITPVVAAESKMLIYSQQDGSLLGCVGCPADDPRSVENVGKLFHIPKDSPYSPCNPKAKYPPIIKDEQGKEFGELHTDTNRPRVRLKDGMMKKFVENSVCR